MISTDDLAWTYCFHHLMACVDRPKMLLQNIHNHVCIWCPNQTTLWIRTTVSTSNPVRSIIKNWNIHGNIALGKLNYRTAVNIFTVYLIWHTFSTNCVHCYTLSFFKKKKGGGNQTIFNINTYFMIIPHMLNFKLLLNYTKRKLNFWLWNKTAYTRWFKYDRDWFVCKQVALRSSCATLREWSHNLHPPSCSG